MGFIDDELQEVSKLCQNVIEGSRLVSCVRTMVRVEITFDGEKQSGPSQYLSIVKLINIQNPYRKTVFKKIIACIQFPSNYPQESLLIELKSKTLSVKLLDGLTEVCEKECKTLLGKAQILPILKLIKRFVDTNPLICCYDEISSLKKLMKEGDELRLKQKSSSINCEIYEDAYYYKIKIDIPDNYPNSVISLRDAETNFPSVFIRFLDGQARELGRRCVEPPIKKQANQPPFVPSPSLHTVVSFLIRTVKRLPREICLKCKITCLPSNPKDVIVDEHSDMHIERLYCGHLIHLQCLITYMKTPPFHGGKKCLECGQRIYHEKWGLCDKLAEARWAHEQARIRELAEVTDFFQ